MVIARSHKHLAHVRTLPCAWCSSPPPNEASHHGQHGTSIKPDDYRAIPLCRRCHADYHRTGGLGHMDGGQTEEWAVRAAWRILRDRLMER